jgi:hypothetical protein
LEPIGNNELARLAEVAQSTAKAFLDSQFQGQAKYEAVCRVPGALLMALKVINQDFAPHELFGRSPDDGRDRDED